MKIQNLFATAIVATATVASPSMAQVISVSQLQDVQPTDWSYQALSNLISRYGCVAGYPNLTFKPGQPATRAELAALTNACLERITEFYSEADARTASALRAEFSRELSATNTRVSALELASARKAQGVSNYVGAGVLLNRQGVDENGYTENRTVLGANLQARYAIKTFTNQNSVSVRSYVNLLSSPNNQFGSAGGAMISYDWSVSRASSGVSKANLYAGVGYQIPFINNSQANFQSAIGERGQVVFALGGEARLTNSLVGYMDLKFPTTNATNAYGATGGAYSPVLTTGIGIKFN